MPLNSDLMFDLDAKDTGYQEQLFIVQVGKERWMILREPTQSQVGGMLLTLSGKRGDPNSAVRDFLDSTILSTESLREHADEDTLGLAPELTAAEAIEMLDDGRLVDVDFLLERLKDPEYSFNETDLTEFVKDILKRRTGFPTKPSSGSTSTPSRTGSNSRAGSRRATSTRST